MIITTNRQFACIFAFFLLFFTANAQNSQFSKFFSFGANNPMSNSIFTNCHQLKHQNGYLLTAERYTSQNVRNTVLIRTDTALNEIWSSMLNFNSATAPYDNISFSDVGELLNGNYFLFGQAGYIGTPYYVVFVLDTNGNLINYTSLHDSQNNSNAAVIPMIRVAADSSLIIAVSEYERFGFYRLDQNLNVISSQLFTSSFSTGWGRDCLMLHDTTLLIAGDSTALILTKTTTSGSVIWSKWYPWIGNCFNLYEAPSGSLYAAGVSHPNASDVAYIAKFGPGGHLTWYHTYTLANSLTMSAIWNIYPDGNNLMLYSDSIMFETDTLGFPISNGFTVNSSSFKVMKPCDSNEFMVAGPIFQDSVMDYRHTIMRFNMNTVSGCLHPRGISTNTFSTSAVPVFLTPLPHTLQTENILFSDTIVQMGYDPLNGCPPNPAGISENGTLLNAPFIFPNPASDELTIHYIPKDPQAKLSFEITDVSGRMVKEEQMKMYSANEFQLSVRELSEGIYTISVYENGIPAGHALSCIKH
jgi:hypothetical protein